jgi:magnesium transporter
MIGVLSLDQIASVMQEEAEEDIMKMGGVSMADLYSAFFKTARHRFPWLFFNLITACIASTVVMLFQKQISHLAILAAVMPIVASMSGNAGTQSTTVYVRAIANKDIIAANMWQIVLKEVLSSILNGALLGVIGGLILFVMYSHIKLSIIFGMAVLTNFTLAGLWGSFVPITIHRLGLDPAISSSVFVTFLTDLLGFFIFLSLAALFL